MAEVCTRPVLRLQHLRPPDEEQDPFELVLTRAPPEFSIKHELGRKARAPSREDYVERLKIALGKARESQNVAQARYKKTFDKRVRRVRKLKPD